MVLRMLKISLFLILVVSFLGFSVDKKLEKRKANPEKMKLVKTLTQKNPAHAWKTKPTPKVSLDISKVTRTKGRTKKPQELVAAMPIADYYGDDVAAVDNFASMAGLTSGMVIGSSSFTYATAYYPRNIAIGSDGVVHAVWSTAGDPSNVVMYAKSADGGETWTTPAVINDGYYGYKPSIDVDFNNPMNVHVAYVGYMNAGETRTTRYVKSEDGGNTWLSSVLIAGSAANCNNPDIMVDQSGNPHIAFDSYSDDFIRYNYSADGGATWFTEPEIVNTGFSGGTFSASITIDPNGNPHVLFGGGGGANTWGDKNTMWNWRDMATGTWQEVPPVELSTGETGSPYPSMVFDSQGIGHCFFDWSGTTAGRGVWYRQYDPATGWGTAVEVPPSIPGGYVMMPQVGIDADDHLFVGYFDGLGGSMSLEPSEGDFFTGTNISGSWQYVNVSGNGPNVHESHPNVARHVLSDSVFHCLYSVGDGPVDIVYEVGYPWPPNPKCGVNQLPNTFNLSGPFHVVATTSDLDGVVVSCSLYVWLNGDLVDAIDMTSTSPDVWEADFTITGSVGDEINYQAVATDNDGLKGESFLTIFDILEPVNPGADILLVGDDMQLLDIFDAVISDLGFVYEYWDVDENAGIDASVTMWGWNNIIVAGWVIGSVPTRDYTGSPYATFLDNGGNMALLSMDWFYGQGEDAGDIFFDPGDFAYDYFQIGGGTNDPGQDADSLLIGVAGDPISGDWSDTPLKLNATLAGISNWIDWTAATGSGVDCFYAFNQGFGTGVWNDAGTFKALYLSWMFDWLVTEANGAVVPSDDAYTLMDNILTWFGALSPPVFGELSGPRYGVYGYGPFDVGVEAFDYALSKGASVTTVEVGYMIDDDVNYTWVPLNPIGGDVFEGQIPTLTQDDTTVTYVFRATDDDGLIGLSDPRIFWTTGLEATEGVNLLYCGDDPYDWYYTGQGWPYVVDDQVTGTLDAIGVAYDYWDADENGPPDYQTVLSNYTSVIWHGYADWIPETFPMYTDENTFYPFLMDGGNLLFSSEEMLGTWYDWPGDYSPGPGETAYDVLNVGWIGADFNYDTSRVFSTSDPLTTGMDSILSLVQLPFGFMGDLADPVYYGDPNNVYIFDAWLPAYGAWYGDWGYGVGWYYEDPTYGYKLITMAFCLANLDATNRATFLANVEDWFGVTSVDQKIGDNLPTTFALRNNYPNPFNPTTSIVYDLPKTSRVELSIYNVLGQKIRTLINGNKSAGRYLATWDGRDDAGIPVTSGVYFYKIMAGDFIQSHKMMLVK